jgi:hypothetical protein
MGAHASATVVGLGVSDAMIVAVTVEVIVSVSVGSSVAGAPPGRLQASIARVMKNMDKIMFLFFASIRFSSKRLMPAL